MEKWNPVEPREECPRIVPETGRNCKAHLTWRNGQKVCPICNKPPYRKVG